MLTLCRVTEWLQQLLFKHQHHHHHRQSLVSCLENDGKQIQSTCRIASTKTFCCKMSTSVKKASKDLIRLTNDLGLCKEKEVVHTSERETFETDHFLWKFKNVSLSEFVRHNSFVNAARVQFTYKPLSILFCVWFKSQLQMNNPNKGLIIIISLGVIH